MSQEKVYNLKKRFEIFSRETSCHGFLQLYSAKSRISAFVWLTLIGGSFIITGYLCYLSIRQYFNQPTSAILSPAKEEQILYPPLRLCYENWMFWVDPKSVEKFNISKEALLFALNYYETIFTENKKFNITKAEWEFRNVMLENNITLLSDFYFTIYRHTPIESRKNNITEYFNTINIVYNDPNSFLFCYGMSESQVLKYFKTNMDVFQSQQSAKTISFSVSDKTYNQVQNYVTANEYNHYMRQWVWEKSAYSIRNNHLTADLKKFAPPVLLYPNAFEMKGAEISSENDAYFLNFWTSCYNLKSTQYNKCKQDYRSIAANDSCKLICKARHWNNVCSCMPLNLAIIINADKLDRLCQKGILYVSPENRRQQSNRLLLTKTSYIYSNQTCLLDTQETSQIYQQCKMNCTIPCEKWTYGNSVIAKTTANFIRQVGVKTATDIVIQYPYANNIIVMTEVNSESWENIVGSVGGLLGIFTGASILSLFELIYLCFFRGDTCFGDCFGNSF